MATIEPTVLCVSLTPDGAVGAGWGRAQDVALATLGDDGEIATWEEVHVGWGDSHPRAHGPGLAPLTLSQRPDVAGAVHRGNPEAGHHAQVVRFLRDNRVGVVITGHMGPGMAHVMDKLGIATLLGVTGPARDAVKAAPELLADL